MNPPPLSQPAPFTCSNCGALLQDQSELCPRCGARPKSQRSRLSVVATILLTLGLLIFGSIGACSGYLGVLEWSKPSAYGWLAVVTILFGVFVGLVGFGLCLLPFFRRKR